MALGSELDMIPGLGTRTRMHSPTGLWRRVLAQTDSALERAKRLYAVKGIDQNDLKPRWPASRAPRARCERNAWAVLRPTTRAAVQASTVLRLTNQGDEFPIANAGVLLIVCNGRTQPKPIP